jgi:hypothetical protein
MKTKIFILFFAIIGITASAQKHGGNVDTLFKISEKCRLLKEKAHPERNDFYLKNNGKLFSIQFEIIPGKLTRCMASEVQINKDTSEITEKGKIWMDWLDEESIVINTKTPDNIRLYVTDLIVCGEKYDVDGRLVKLTDSEAKMYFKKCLAMWQKYTNGNI